MELIPFLLVNLGGLAILHFAWIPSLERRLRMDRSMATISRAGLLSLLGFARSVFLVGSLTTALLIVILFILNRSGGVTTAEVTSAIERIHRWRTLLIGMGPVWSGVVMILLIVALGLYSRRSSRRNMVRVFREMYARKFEQLRKDYELGNLPERPPTHEMREVAKKIGEFNQALTNLEGEDVGADPKIVLAREQLNAQIDLLQRYYVSLDLQRRIDLELDPDDAALPEARTKWEKFQIFFMSRGLIASLNRTSRALFFATLILLVPSLTGVYSPTIGASLNRHLVELKDLRVELSRREFEQEKARLGEPNRALSEEDKRDLKEIAQSYERSVFQLPTGSALRSATYGLRSMVVRETVLTQATRQANVAREQYGSSASWEQHASGSRIQNLTPLEREIVLAPEQVINAHGPVTPNGQRLYVELEDIARRSPSFMEQLRTGMRSFQRPASSYDICNSLYSQMAGTLAGDASPELGNAIRGITINSRYPAFNGFTDMQAREFLSDLMKGSSLEEAIGRVNAAESRYPFLGRIEKLEFHATMRTVTDDLPFISINEKLVGYPPSVDVAPEAHVNMRKAVEAVERYRNSPAGALLGVEESADPLATFSDWFPAQVNIEKTTPRGELIAKWAPPAPGDADIALRKPAGPRVPGGSGVGALPPEPEIPIPNPAGGTSWRNFLRGRDFSWLRSFSRVGGVLIGQRANETGVPRLNFADLRWETNGSHVSFVLMGADGQQIRSRPYRASISYQALNYAADGRPLAATMVTAQPLVELRILLHPTLEDTPLGLRILELDRLVDEYTVKNPVRVEAENRVEAHDLLYQFSWAVRALAYLDDQPQLDSDPKIQDFQKRLRGLVQDQELRTSVRDTLKELATVADPRLSPLTVKQEFYDQTLVDILVKAPPETTLDSLTDTIRAAVTRECIAAANSEDEDRQKALRLRWLSPPPKIIIWSGVREREFDVNPANLMVADGAAMPMPFDFMLQVAFSSQPFFLDNLNAENYADTHPWEFPALREMIHTTVLEKVAQDPRAREIVKDSAEFTMLQRLFRMALNGQLGENFPVEKIVELHQALSASAPQKVTRTLRWHNPVGFDVIAAQLELAQASSKNANVEREQVAPQPGGSGSFINPRQKDIQALTLIEEIRQQLGVAKDDEQAKKERKAPLSKLQ